MPARASTGARSPRLRCAGAEVSGMALALAEASAKQLGLFRRTAIRASQVVVVAALTAPLARMAEWDWQREMMFVHRGALLDVFRQVERHGVCRR